MKNSVFNSGDSILLIYNRTNNVPQEYEWDLKQYPTKNVMHLKSYLEAEQWSSGYPFLTWDVMQHGKNFKEAYRNYRVYVKDMERMQKEINHGHEN